MTIELTIVIALTVLALILFVTEVLRVEVVALIVLAVLLLSGILTAEEGLQGFSNEATVAIGAMFVLSEGLRQTGVLKQLAGRLGQLFRYHYRLALLVMMTGVAVVSAFINNVAVVAIMLPVMLGMCRSIGISPSRVLIPLSFSAMFGGCWTLIGTSSNLLVSGLITEQGLAPIGMFEITHLGMIFFVVGTIYLLTVGQWLLPDRNGNKELRQAYELEEYRAELQLQPEHPAVGQQASEFFPNGGEAQLIGVLRNGVLVAGELEEISLESNDVLRISAAARVVKDLDDSQDLKIMPLEKSSDKGLKKKTVRQELFEVVISPDSAVVGQTLREAGFERHHPAFVIALRRAGKVVVEDILNVQLQGGDILLMQAPHDQLRRLQESGDFIVVSEVGTPVYKEKLVFPVILVILAVVLLAAIGWMPIVNLAVAAGVILVVIRALSIEDAYEAIDWQVIFLLGGFIPLGTALQKVGAIELIADGLVGWLGAYGPLALLAGFYFVTNFMSDIISNQATAVLITPVALATAISLGVDPRPFVIAIAFASSNSFASPVGYHTNVMIYGAGNYRYLDFVKVGLPLNLLFLGTAVIFLPRFWAF